MRSSKLYFVILLSLFCGMLLQGWGCSKSSPTSPTSGVWLEATADAPWAPRYGIGGTVFNGTMYVIGGASGSGSVTNYYGDVYSSSDGITWKQNNSSAPFGARYSPGVLSFNGKLWVIGGNKGGTLMNDVWNSSDGTTWNQVTTAAPIFTPREDFIALSFNGAMYVISGWSAGTADNDIWTSADGANWSKIAPAVAPLATNPSGFVARWGAAGTIFNSLIWIYGGASGLPTATNLGGLYDEWTFDGTNLVQINDTGLSSNGYNLVYAQLTGVNGTLWLTPGSTPTYPPITGYLTSSDGINWGYHPSYYPARDGHLALSYNNQLWVMGGFDTQCWGTAACAVTYYNDVWHSP